MWFGMLYRKKELMVRKAILRGVYEDNLKIIGKYRKIASYKIYSPLKVFIFFLATLVAILGHINYLNLPIPIFPEKKMAATLITPETSLPPERLANPSEYNAFLNNRGVPLSHMFGLGIKTIMIDPGHGGSDSGAIGKMGTREKDITLDLAKRLRERLEKYGNYNVLMTREDDSTISLQKRVELAHSNRADLFISIHLNYLPFKPLNIIETYYFGPSSDDRTLKLAEKENAGSEYGLSDFKELVEKIGETLKLQESRELATSIQKKLFLNSRRQNGDIHDFGVKRAPFVVLLGVDVPAVLVEVSCLSNREEEIKLSTESHREDIARYLEAGILGYLNNKGEISYEAKKGR